MTTSKKNMNLAISISGKNYIIRIFKDVVRTLGYPNYICLRIKNNDFIALTPSDQKENMSFKVPSKLFTSPSAEFVITSKSFVTNMLSNNVISPKYTYRLFGYYSKDENAVFFNISNAELIQYKTK